MRRTRHIRHAPHQSARVTPSGVYTPVTPIFAVVVNWDGGEQNLACLASVEDAGIPAERVVFVDNEANTKNHDTLIRDLLSS